MQGRHLHLFGSRILRSFARSLCRREGAARNIRFGLSCNKEVECSQHAQPQNHSGVEMLMAWHNTVNTGMSRSYSTGTAGPLSVQGAAQEASDAVGLITCRRASGAAEEPARARKEEQEQGTTRARKEEQQRTSMVEGRRNKSNEKESKRGGRTSRAFAAAPVLVTRSAGPEVGSEHRLGQPLRVDCVEQHHVARVIISVLFALHCRP